MQTIHTVVFQAQAGGGNPCPVTLDADALTTEQMQRMTKEFGEESVFLMKPTRSDCDIKARYFVPMHEMEMCIHATIGSAVVLVTNGLFQKSPIIYETTFGAVQVDWERNADSISVAVHQFLPKFKQENPTVQEVCRALNISQDELWTDMPIESAATSRFKLIVPLKSRDTLDALQPDFEYLWELCDKYDTTGFYPFAMEKEQDNTVFFARQFPKRAGYPEDPATGVAASALGAYLAQHQVLPIHSGWNRYTIKQGFAMGRPSIIHSDIKLEAQQITATRICGSAYIL